MPRDFLNTVIKFAFIIAIGIIAALLVANRSDYGKVRNDTEVYAAHHSCISSTKSIELCRNEYGGIQYEFFYETFIYFLTANLGLDDFYYIKLATGIVVYLMILAAVGLQSKNVLLSLFILLLDFRFWEYGANVLRHGFATAFLVVGLLLLLRGKSKQSLVARVFAVSSHLSATVLIYLPKKKYKWSTLAFFSFITAAILLASEYWIPVLLAANFANYKIGYYLGNSDGYNFSFPLHYTFFLISGLVLYGKANSKIFIITFNALIPLFLASVVLGHLDTSYRMTSFMLPLLAINIPEQISMVARRFNDKKLVTIIFSSLVGSLMAFIAYRNWDSFLIHLG